MILIVSFVEDCVCYVDCRCGSENSELRIPVFPAPPASPSPSQCDSPSPAPLALTPEEHAQLLHCKVHGLPTPAPAKPIPYGALSLVCV